MKMLLCLLFFLQLSVRGNDSISQEGFLKRKYDESYQKFKTFRENNPSRIDPALVQSSLKEMVDFSLEKKGTFHGAFLENLLQKHTDEADRQFIANDLVVELLNAITTKKSDLAQRQAVLHFILKLQFVNGDIHFAPVDYRKYFDPLDYDTTTTKNLLKKIILSDAHVRFLYLVEYCDLEKDQRVTDYLETQSRLCTEWGENKRWLSLLLLAHRGDEEKIRSAVAIVRKELAKEPKFIFLYQMPFQLSIIHHELIVDLLKECLSLKHQFPSSGDHGRLSIYAAKALSEMLVGFPAVDSYSLDPAQLERCKAWFADKLKYEYRSIAGYPDDIFRRIFR